VDLGTTREYVHSVQFQMSKDAIEKLQSLGSGAVSLVQLKVNPTNETIELATAKKVDLEGLKACIPTDEPRFSIFRYHHDFDGETFDSVVFIYSCTNNSPVKLKMLYSTVKAVANGTCEQIGLKIDKKIEISEPEELTDELLETTLHPPSENKAQTFNRPSRPGRGRARLVRGGKS